MVHPAQSETLALDTPPHFPGLPAHSGHILTTKAPNTMVLYH